MKAYYERKLNYQKSSYVFREEAMEQALLEIKLHAQTQVERYQMEKEDIESQFTRFITTGMGFYLGSPK